MKDLPFSRLDRHLLPPPLSQVLDELVHEQSVSGIHTTADETAAAIEAWYRLLGGLLVAEYLDAGAPGANLNRWLFSLLRDKRPILAGTWVALGRACLTQLQAVWKRGRVPTWDGLPGIDLGDQADVKHPVSQLMNYRNHFSHGAFSQVEEEILAHGQLLEQQIGQLAVDLAERPLHMVNADGGVTVLQGAEPGTYAHLSADALAPADLPFATPYVVMPEGDSRVLAPAVQLTLTASGTWTVGHVRLADEKRSLEPSLSQRFAENLERFRREQAGHLRFDDHEAPQSPEAEDHEVAGFHAAIDAGHVLTRVEFRPGTGQYRLAARLWFALDKRMDDAFLWRVVRDAHDTHPSADGNVFARALLRHAEDVLGLTDGELEVRGKDLPMLLAEAGRALAKHKKKLGCVVMDADAGMRSPTSVGFSVIDACKAAAGGLRIVLLARPSRAQSPPHDGAALRAPLPGAEWLDLEELQMALNSWCGDQRELRSATLQRLVAAGDHWASVEDPLEAAVEDIEQHLGREIFPPAIEHALWTAAPFVEQWRLDNQATRWSMPASPGGAYQAAIARLLSDDAAHRGDGR